MPTNQKRSCFAFVARLCEFRHQGQCDIKEQQTSIRESLERWRRRCISMSMASLDVDARVEVSPSTFSLSLYRLVVDCLFPFPSLHEGECIILSLSLANKGTKMCKVKVEVQVVVDDRRNKEKSKHPLFLTGSFFVFFLVLFSTRRPPGEEK